MALTLDAETARRIPKIDALKCTLGVSLICCLAAIFVVMTFGGPF